MGYEKTDIKHLLKIMGYSEGTHFTVDEKDFVAWISDAAPPSIEDLEALYAEIVAEDGSLEGRRWAILREARTAELYRTDWTDLSNCQLDAGDVTAYLTWRQSLRDIPQSYPEIDDAEAQLPIVIANEPTV